MAITLDGVTLDSTTDSGTTPVDNGGDNGSIWSSIFANAGSIFTGGAALVTAFKGTQPVTNVYQNTPTTTSMLGSNIWLWVIIALVIIVVLFLVLKK